MGPLVPPEPAVLDASGEPPRRAHGVVDGLRLGEFAVEDAKDLGHSRSARDAATPSRSPSSSASRRTSSTNPAAHIRVTRSADPPGRASPAGCRVRSSPCSPPRIARGSGSSLCGEAPAQVTTSSARTMRRALFSSMRRRGVGVAHAQPLVQRPVPTAASSASSAARMSGVVPGKSRSSRRART